MKPALVLQPGLPAAAICSFILTLAMPLGYAAERTLLSPPKFQEQLGAIEAAPTPDAQRLQAEALVRGRFWLSSQQVKAAALHIQDEEARLAFALAAHPRTVDPENFYDVYDAFTKFSTVFRLHDRIRRGPPPPEFVEVPVPVPAPAAASREEMADVLKALKAESFDSSRLLLARQIVTARPRFASRQIRELLQTFTFDDSRLELAKEAYGMVLDPENYFLVNEAFTFSSSGEALSKHIQSARQPRRPASK